MKKAGKYLLCFILIMMMLVAVGCGCGAAGTTDDLNQTNQSQTDPDVMETTGGGTGSLNGPTENPGVIGDIETGAEDLLDDMGMSDDIVNGMNQTVGGTER